MKDSEVAFLTLNWFFRSQRRSFCIAFILNNLYLAHCLFSYVSLGKHWIMRKFEEYLINVRLKANLDQLVVMHAILMIWNFKGKRIVTSFLFCFVFFLRKKKACHRGHCPAILLESRILILLNFFLTIIPSV